MKSVLTTTLNDYDFELPEALVAKYPCEQRDGSRLLVSQNGKIEHRLFKDISEYFQTGDILVRNVTKVLAARFYVFSQTGGKIEILLTQEVRPLTWEFLAKPMKKLKVGETYKTESGHEIEIASAAPRDDNMGHCEPKQSHCERSEAIPKLIKFKSQEDFDAIIAQCGQMPIPPYLKREAEDLDKERYQTVFAKAKARSIAAPTASLHFTDEIFDQLRAQGVEILDLVLDVGLGTFLPVKVDKVEDHKMHSENFSISTENWQKILEAKQKGRRIIGIGTTVCRCLEALAPEIASASPRNDNIGHGEHNNRHCEQSEVISTSKSLRGEAEAISGSTDIFIYPPYKFKIIDALITNFHLPKSTLLMLVSALVGKEQIDYIYKEAIREEYRFFSYGDAMLLVS